MVDLSYNKLAVLREGLLEQALCAVRQLILSHNQIDRLPRYMLEHLPYLTHLDLSYNALTWLDVGAFTNPSLSVIDLSGNRLRKIVSMTFLYLPALRSVDLARNEISYVYKFAFYRMCSDASRPIAVSLRANRLDVDAVWKLLTTFEHLENDGCRVLVDLRDNSVERFLAPDTLAFVRKRVTAAADDLEDAPSQLQHFRRWTPRDRRPRRKPNPLRLYAGDRAADVRHGTRDDRRKWLENEIGLDNDAMEATELL